MNEAERKLSSTAKAILALFREGHTDEYIASRLKLEERAVRQARMSMVRSAISLWAVAVEMAPAPPPNARMVVPSLEDVPRVVTPALRQPARVAESDPRRASILHLVDLKRAGHSPRRTELIIHSEGAVATVNQYRTHGSVVGSSSAMCCD